jgi:hypothetical protein
MVRSGFTSAIERHAACSGEVMLLESSLLDDLLGGYVAYCEEH